MFEYCTSAPVPADHREGPNTSPSSTIDVLVQGVAHTISATQWDLTLTVTPALTLPAWELEDATLGTLGSTTRLAYP